MTSPVHIEPGPDAVRGLLRRAVAVPTVLAVLTDEELLAIEGPEVPHVADTPFTDREEVDTRVYASAALRSLVARGLVDVPSSGEEETAPAPGERRLDPTLAGITALRRHRVGALTAYRQVPEQLTELVVHVAADGGVLEELVTAEGYHYFSVPLRAEVPHRLCAYIDPDVSAGEDLELFSGSLEELQEDTSMTERVDDARAITEILGTGAADGVQHTLFTTVDRVFDLDTSDAEPAPTARLRSVSREALLELLAELLPDPAHAAVPSTGSAGSRP